MSVPFDVKIFQGCIFYCYYAQADVYNVDDWEVSRDLIEKGEELGSGSFGICHRGIYHHPEKVASTVEGLSRQAPYWIVF